MAVTPGNGEGLPVSSGTVSEWGSWASISPLLVSPSLPQCSVLSRNLIPDYGNLTAVDILAALKVRRFLNLTI
ncbi:MAG: hypothetical protein IM550_05850 [Microcystis sp. M54BS1]|jgi:hypothetical protein|uniref:hypothetical protein n=1 Tax=Microcystis TaxID=1125 RepID=UPI000B109FF5|nr:MULTISPECIES: hypothetical protein [Microcystis]MBE5228026.1 hypothetical protein [Microcystis aeruginosa PMC 728.11]MCA2538765.1 hypothetical protein [Microcystis sp. M54BS1]MCA2596298.1 hypothetical protein [Microcystis sp. M38BS1]MCA2609940.1 hypothetical protein [Microcystis sp. M27BS1]MCA2504884.1 hypothetical protein [Microcystis sp. M62BS1]